MEPSTPIRHRQKVILKRACKNLLDAFRQPGKLYRYQSSLRFCEILRLRRERLKSQYHQQPHPFFGKNTTFTTELFMCETGDGKPNLRRQLQAYVARRNSPANILGSSKYLLKKFINAFPPYDFSKYHTESEKKLQIIQMSCGKYLHFGIKHHLQVPERSSLTISVNIGLYVVDSISKGVLRINNFVIVGKQVGVIKSFVIGVYCGSFPIEIIANEILQPLVAEIQHLKDESISIENRSYRFLVNSIICDPIAYSLATCTSMPDSMYGCSRCKSEGSFSNANNSTSFPTASSELRDDDDFKFCVASEHHLIPPVLADIGVGLISQVSIDYKHFVCLGVMKNLIHMWMTGDVQLRLNRRKIDAINKGLVELTASCPSEFREKPKPLDCYMSWTAYDFRQFLLYYGPIVLRGHLARNIYLHFLHLNMAIRIALDTQRSSDVTYFLVDNLLKSFVKDFAHIYGYERVDYNVHNLLHVEHVARKSRCLEKVGGFQFEKSMQTLEALFTNSNCSVEWLNKLADIITKENRTVFTRNQAKSTGTTISTEEPDNHYITLDGIFQVNSIKRELDGETALYGYRFMHSSPFTSVQTSSQNILIIREQSGLERLTMERIICKAVVFKNRGKLYAMPLLDF